MEMKAKALENQHDPDEKWEDIHYDLGPCPCRICACFMGTTVDFKDNHITFKDYFCWCLCKSEAEYPYGEISGVTQNQQYGCCWLITGLQEPVAPGCPCCCERQLVKAFVKEVKKRSRSKGDAAQLKATYDIQDNVRMMFEQMGVFDRKLDSQEKKLDAIMAQMRIGVTDMA